MSKYGRSEGDGKRLFRLPGDAPYYCLHCGQWTQQHPLTICETCRQKYEEAKATMPTAKASEML